MRQLQEITDAARRGEPVTEEELRLAVCAYDVFIAQLELEKDPKQLAKFFVAAESDPREYIGPANDPDNPEVVAWHKAFINVSPELVPHDCVNNGRIMIEAGKPCNWCDEFDYG